MRTAATTNAPSPIRYYHVKENTIAIFSRVYLLVWHGVDDTLKGIELITFLSGGERVYSVSRISPFYCVSRGMFLTVWQFNFWVASFVGSALEQMHIFALAHILRRPIIVYGVKYVKTFRGESIDLAKFQGQCGCLMNC